jgi:hypothetical protein
MLLAPLYIKEQAVPSHPIEFAGGSFLSDVRTEATYKFNSWRLTYRYLLFDKSKWHGWIGFTAKIRDAKIRLRQDSVSAEETDLGFVPLLHLAFEYQMARSLWFALDLDALAGGPGRAEDLSLKLRYILGDGFSIAAGYRTVEGGADVERVYNFAWLHYAVFSVRYEF